MVILLTGEGLEKQRSFAISSRHSCPAYDMFFILRFENKFEELYPVGSKIVLFRTHGGLEMEHAKYRNNR